MDSLQKEESGEVFVRNFTIGGGICAAKICGKEALLPIFRWRFEKAEMWEGEKGKWTTNLAKIEGKNKGKYDFLGII
jgi:hypothetical protein